MAATSVDAHGFVHLFVPAMPGSPNADLTVLALHGTGGDERDLLPVLARVAPGAAVLSPRGPVLEHGMPRFFRRLAEGVFDLDDLTRRTEQLGAFLDAAATAYGLDRERFVAVGFSNGANIAASLLLRRPGSLAGAALLRAMVPFEPEQPLVPRPGVTPRVLVAAGRVDPLVPPAQPERLAALLGDAGCVVDVRWASGGHQLTPDDLAWSAALVREIAATREPPVRAASGDRDPSPTGHAR